MYPCVAIALYQRPSQRPKPPSTARGSGARPVTTSSVSERTRDTTNGARTARDDRVGPLRARWAETSVGNDTTTFPPPRSQASAPVDETGMTASTDRVWNRSAGAVGSKPPLARWPSPAVKRVRGQATRGREVRRASVREKSAKKSQNDEERPVARRECAAKRHRWSLAYALRRPRQLLKLHRASRNRGRLSESAPEPRPTPLKAHQRSLHPEPSDRHRHQPPTVRCTGPSSSRLLPFSSSRALPFSNRRRLDVSTCASGGFGGGSTIKPPWRQSLAPLARNATAHSSVQGGNGAGMCWCSFAWGRSIRIRARTPGPTDHHSSRVHQHGARA